MVYFERSEFWHRTGTAAKRLRQGGPLHAGALGEADAVRPKTRSCTPTITRPNVLCGDLSLGARITTAVARNAEPKSPRSFYTLCETVKLRNVEPRAYLTQAAYAAIQHPGTVILPDVLRDDSAA